jgi:hypothetical protein
MTKAERRDLIDAKINDEITPAQLIAEIMEQSGASESTVRKDLIEMYPDYFEQTPEGAKDLTEGTNAKIVLIEPASNPEMQKGRVTEYVVKESEKGFVHAEIEKVAFSSVGAEAGRKTSVATVQQFNVRAWDGFRKNARNLGFSYVKVLHAPKGANIEIVEPRIK